MNLLQKMRLKAICRHQRDSSQSLECTKILSGLKTILHLTQDFPNCKLTKQARIQEAQ